MKLEELYTIIKDRQAKMPRNSYTASLFSQGKDRIIQKVGEEAVELIIAAKTEDRKKIIAECADLWFHIFVLLASFDAKPDSVIDELEKRAKDRI